MSDRFHPLTFEQLVDWAAVELERRGSVFGVPREGIFVPDPAHRFRTRSAGGELETPFGVAAGPHTQLAQNIVAAWLCGARVIELKTIQTLDELEVHKPCIDMTDEGYNVEWSQELRVHESFDEYLRAWVLVHALHRLLGFPGERPGVVFDMSVGYDLAGIRRQNVQWYLDAMADASAWLPAYLAVVADRWAALGDLVVPARIASTVTLSTMHGCPPDEIERIAGYLLEERGLHTAVKCNPTLLGAERVRGIVNDELGYLDVPIPDEAFGHDLRYEDALPMFGRLADLAATHGRRFGLKLSNTLEVRNWRGVFDRDDTMYLSGRALHPVTANLAATLADDLAAMGGEAAAIPLSFAGGADALNVADLLAGGIATVTVCSDLLKTGGYLRLRQYTEGIGAALDATGAEDLADLVRGTARAHGFAEHADLGACARFNLRRYAAQTRSDRRYRKATLRTDRSKTTRPLGLFDCIAAPCVDECPIDQQVPHYMRAVREGDLEEAVRVTRLDNPLASVLGTVCDHLCERTCVRTHLDEPLAIRHIKRFVMEHEPPDAGSPPRRRRTRPPAARVAIVGAGPAGLAAAEWLVRARLGVTLFEAQPYPGGMVGGAIPEYRLPEARIVRDLARLERLGVEIRAGRRVGVDPSLDDLRAEGFGAILAAVGAQRARTLGLPGEDATGVLDGVTFLRGVREGRPTAVGPRVAVVGAGDTAMDCARTARRLGTEVVLVYRRTIDQMPADREEIEALEAEGIRILELARPTALRVEDGRLIGLVCRRTEYRGDRDAAGRKVPHDVPGSELALGIDTLILAISQDSVLDLFGGRPPELTPGGAIATDPATLATSIPGVWAAGDVAAHGPASIVRAAADGRRAAAAIAASLGVASAGADGPAEPAAAPMPLEQRELHELLLRRAHREYRTPAPTTPLDEREGFAETTLGYTAEEAAREAARCLDCDRLCSLCVGVCPNLALLTYEVVPRRIVPPAAGAAGGAAAVATPFVVDQGYQVAVLTDLCNECGDCVTVCPTAGAPYRDKPRLYLDRADFEAQADNAFLLLGGSVIEGRFDGATHRLAAEDGRLVYTAPAGELQLDPVSLVPVGAPPDDGRDGSLPLEPAAAMATLLDGLARSAPHLPSVVSAGTRVPAPTHASPASR
ncbi:MAG TPA: FAD-dependent oxidoreductase [Candidatus Limnocylindrales bacterium]|nr:FAD-dependent oxidoreductase [Candidatus Limnocylindrales bacterium]